ncbi:abc/ecf transporter transmembrane component [Lucifera butyrica]|uniref:Energy-coupling factor transporter transmembrane protein EcfT n=1 Tax=Lucifera butyrica TaxID=1351585 RepID=A0A498R6W5_9FIRM|nr:energy-coupling factor transporter transmembrane component T [Lucifera butyrica]VBB04868.1 abc/ecf transporter transmembrane component [Lucifera butyrica]
MLTDITLGQYFPGNSFVHRLDPRTKIIATILFISSIFLAERYLAYGLLAGYVVLITLVSRIPFRFVLRSIRPLWFIILLTLGIHIFMTPGKIVYTFGPLIATMEGIRQGLLMAFRLVLLIVVSSLLTFTTSPIALTDGIEQLLNPFRRFGLPAHELAMMMTIALRFIPTLLEETDRIMKAQMARGADFGSGNIFKRAKNMVPLLVPLFISAFRRADELATAMEARCYRGGENRTRMKELQLAGRDWLAAFTLILIIGLLGYLRYGG